MENSIISKKPLIVILVLVLIAVALWIWLGLGGRQISVTTSQSYAAEDPDTPPADPNAIQTVDPATLDSWYGTAAGHAVHGY